MAATTLAPATVFIAEDNPILLHGLARALIANGYIVSTAPDGIALLDLLHSTAAPPDLLLLDVMMPGMTGIEVLQAVQADPRWSGLPVLLITAATDESLPGAALAGGAVEVLAKPFRLDELLSRIEAHIRHARQGREREAAPASLDFPAH